MNITATALKNAKRYCSCTDGCPGLTGKIFSQGHDARMVTRLRDAVLGGKMEKLAAEKELLQRGGSDRLSDKLHNAIIRGMERAEKRSAPRASRNRCAVCKKRPINRDSAMLDSDMCSPCEELAGWENQHSDDAHDTLDAADPEREGCWVCHPELNLAAPRSRKVQTRKVPREKIAAMVVDGFELATVKNETAGFEAKVGRWPYTGSLVEYRIAGGAPADTVFVFEYCKKGSTEVSRTTKFTRI